MLEYQTTVKKEGHFLRFSTYLRDPDCLPGTPKSIQYRDTKLDDNLIRARSTVRGIMLSNEWDYFATLTLNADKVKDRYNFADCIKKWCKFLNNVKYRFSPELQYVLIPEYHQDGAIHAHALLRGLSPDLLCFNEYGYLDFPMYSEKFGFISLQSVRHQDRVAFYMTKYMTKNFGDCVPVGCHTYYASKGLNRPVEVYKGKIIQSFDLATFLLPDGSFSFFSKPEKHFDIVTVDMNKLSPDDLQMLVKRFHLRLDI